MEPTQSTWVREVRAIVLKEYRTEMRGFSAAYTSLMLSAITVFAMAFAFFGRKLTGDGAAGLLWTAMLFAGVSSCTRSFVSEEEIGTGDLLRLWGKPHAIFWGKTLYAMAQSAVTCGLVAVMFVGLTGVMVSRPIGLIVGVLGGAIALAGTVTLVSALIAKGSNRTTLGIVVALPLLLPLVALGVAGGREAFTGTGTRMLETTAGIWLYALLVLSAGPHIFAAIWREP